MGTRTPFAPALSAYLICQPFFGKWPQMVENFMEDIGYKKSCVIHSENALGSRVSESVTGAAGWIPVRIKPPSQLRRNFGAPRRCHAKQAPEQSACPEPSADKADQGSFLSETENARLPLTLRATLMQRRPFQLEHGAHHLATPTSTRRKASSRRSLIHGAFARTRRSYQNPPPQLCQ